MVPVPGATMPAMAILVLPSGCGPFYSLAGCPVGLAAACLLA